MWEIVLAGGPFMWPIILCSVIAVAIVLERLWTLQRRRIVPPDLTRRIAIVILGTIALVGILSVFVRSPLEEPANPLITPNPAKAPWYFLWLQEIVTDTTFTAFGGQAQGQLMLEKPSKTKTTTT